MVQDLIESCLDKLFMCQLYSYHRLLQDEAPDPRKLSSILLQLCSAAATIVSSACDALKSQIGPKIPSTTALQTLSPEVTVSSGRKGPEIALGTMCRAHGRTFAHLLQGFDKLNKTTESRGYQGQVIYSFVKLFGDILNSLQSVSVMQSQVQPRTEIRTHTRKGQIEVFEEIDPGTLDKETDPRVHLCRLLVTMIASLEPAKPGHIDILEGFFYVLLERVGKTLYVFVFDEEESPILANRSHGDRLQYHGIGANLREALKRKAMQGEAKYLIWTLERAMTFVCRHHSVNPTAKVTKKKIKDASTSKAAVSKPPDKTNLSDRARTRLQNTLLKGIFGAGEKEFKDGLRMPAIAEMDLNAELPTVTEDETAEWFKQEVWRLLGWEILGQHDDI